MGEPAAPEAAVAEAATYAREPGYLVLARVLLAQGRPARALVLLDRLIAAQRPGSELGAAAEVPLGCLGRLQGALSTPGAAPAGGLIDPLTSRELEVLEMLAAGASNQTIASQLVVTLDTVKKHVSHVLSKLGAANRTAAVARARELGLIP
jgi:LuxR family maltose regulon positive regulatory protein